jgi:hypothetical protein
MRNIEGFLISIGLASQLMLMGLVEAHSQSPPFSDEKSFVDTSVKAMLGTKGQSRLGSREMFANQVSLLPPDSRGRAFDALVDALRTEQDGTKIEIAGVLAASKVRWAVGNLDAASAMIYGLYLDATDATLKTSLDAALANARGGYKDAIDNYNSDNVASLSRATDIFRSYVDKFPKSRFAEPASYYVGHSFLKRFSLGDARGKQLVSDSNSAFESYIARAERGDFIKTDNLAAAYYFRALNGVVAGDKKDNMAWLDKGGAKFSDSDRVYIYELFFSTNRDVVLDKYFPAKTLFSTTTNFIKDSASFSVDRQGDLVKQIRDIGQSVN